MEFSRNAYQQTINFCDIKQGLTFDQCHTHLAINDNYPQSASSSLNLNMNDQLYVIVKTC